MRFMKLLGERIRRERRERGLTQEQLAAKSGVGEASIARLEAGRVESGTIQDPRLSTLVKIANALDMTVHDLLPTAEEIHAAYSEQRISE